MKMGDLSIMRYNLSLLILTLVIIACGKSTTKTEQSDKEVSSASSLGADTLFAFDLDGQCSSESEFNDILSKGKTVVKSDTFPVLVYGEKGDFLDLNVRPMAILPLLQDTLLLVTPIDTTQSSAICTDLIQFLTRCDRERLFIEIWLRDIQNYWPVDRVQWLDPNDFKN